MNDKITYEMHITLCRPNMVNIACSTDYFLQMKYILAVPCNYKIGMGKCNCFCEPDSGLSMMHRKHDAQINLPRTTTRFFISSFISDHFLLIYAMVRFSQPTACPSDSFPTLPTFFSSAEFR